MSIITKVYDWVYRLAQKPYAEPALYGISFIESIFLPIPTSTVLLPICLAQPKIWLRLIILTTVTSVLGGMVTFWIGAYFQNVGMEIVTFLGKEKDFATISNIIKDGDTLWIFLAAFTPLPFKIFALAFGMFELDFTHFVIVSSFGRFAQFFLVGATAAYLGANYIEKIRSIVSRIGWLILLIGILALVMYKFFV